MALTGGSENVADGPLLSPSVTFVRSVWILSTPESGEAGVEPVEAADDDSVDLSIDILGESIVFARSNLVDNSQPFLLLFMIWIWILISYHHQLG